MKQNLFKKVLIVCLVLIIGIITGYKLKTYYNNSLKDNSSVNIDNTYQKQSSHRIVSDNHTNISHNNMRFPINWRLSSENVPYPDIQNLSNLNILVSVKQQRVFIRNGNQILYTMYCSTGTPSEPSPIGHFHIQSERGRTFYNPKTNMGANYWVSFKDNGVYLFHSVPINANGQYIISEAQKLGKQSGSHGCVRLSVSDAKWFYQNIPNGTPVTITQK